MLTTTALVIARSQPVSPELLFGVVVVVGLVMILAYYYSRRQKLLRALRAVPVRPIAELQDGERARIVGQVVVSTPSGPTPLTGRQAVYFEVIVEEYRRRGKHGQWRQIIRETGGVPFVLEDATGRASVDPRAGEVVLHMDTRTSSGTFDPADAAQAAFLARHGASSTGILFNRTLRYREGALEPGERVAVLGLAEREVDPDAAPRADYRSGRPTRLRLHGAPHAPLLISDEVEVTRS